MYYKLKYIILLFALGTFGIFNASLLKLNGNPNYHYALSTALILYWLSIIIFIIQNRKKIFDLFRK